MYCLQAIYISTFFFFFNHLIIIKSILVWFCFQSNRLQPSLLSQGFLSFLWQMASLSLESVLGSGTIRKVCLGGMYRHGFHTRLELSKWNLSGTESRKGCEGQQEFLQMYHQKRKNIPSGIKYLLTKVLGKVDLLQYHF